MPTVLLRIFLLYNLLHSFLLYLLPKKLHSFLPSSWFPTSSLITAAPLPSRPSPEKRMDTAELNRVFEMFDRNGDGKISKKELADSFENLGIFIPDKDLTDMIAKIDVNGDGFVDADEFGVLYRSILDERDEEEDMREAFNVFDENGDGFITVEELRSVLVSLGLKQGRTVDECKMMIKKVDADGDGRVDYNEFRQMMKCGGFGALAAGADH